MQKNWQDDLRILDFTGYGQKLQEFGAAKAASILHSDARSCLDERSRIIELSKKLEVDAAINLLKRNMWYHDFATPIPESNRFEPSDITPWQLAKRPEMQLLRSRLKAGIQANQVGLLLAGLYRSWGLDDEAEKTRDFFCDQTG